MNFLKHHRMTKALVQLLLCFLKLLLYEKGRVNLRVVLTTIIFYMMKLHYIIALMAFSSILPFAINDLLDWNFISEAYSESCQTSKMERFPYKVTACSYKPLPVFAKLSILDVLYSSEYASVITRKVGRTPKIRMISEGENCDLALILQHCPNGSRYLRMDQVKSVKHIL